MIELPFSDTRGDCIFLVNNSRIELILPSRFSHEQKPKAARLAEFLIDLVPSKSLSKFQSPWRHVKTPTTART